MAASSTAHHVCHNHSCSGHRFNPNASQYRCCRFCCCRCCHVRTASLVLSSIHVFLALIRLYQMIQSKRVVDAYGTASVSDFVSYYIQLAMVGYSILAVITLYVGVCREKPRLLLPYMLWHILCAFMVTLAATLLIIDLTTGISWFSNEHEVSEHFTNIYGTKYVEDNRNKANINTSNNNLSGNSTANTAYHVPELPAGYAFMVILVLALVCIWNLWVFTIVSACRHYLIAKLDTERRRSINGHQSITITQQRLPINYHQMFCTTNDEFHRMIPSNIDIGDVPMVPLGAPPSYDDAMKTNVLETKSSN